MTTIAAVDVPLMIDEKFIFNHLSQCVFLCINKNKNSESIWFKDKDNNFQVIIRNYLNFNLCTVLCNVENKNIAESFDKKLFDDIKNLCMK